MMMARRPLLTGLAAVWAASGTRAGAQTPAPFAKVHDLLKGAVDAGTLPGGQVLVVDRGRVVFNEAMGVAGLPGVPTDRKATTDTVVWLASTTKPIIAAALMMLLDEGKIALDDPVSKYIPELAGLTRVRVLKAGSPSPNGPPGAAGTAPKPEWDYVPAKQAITLRDLLSHVSGLQHIMTPNEFLPATTPEDTLATWTPKVAVMPLENQPGEGWGYSNVVGFDVLARVIEVASGKPVDVFIAERIFRPLGMTDFGWGAMYDARADRAVSTGTSTRPAVRDGRVLKSGAAGLWGPLEQYATFLQMIANGGEYAGRRYLKRETVAMMHANQTGQVYKGQNGKTPGMAFGLSFEVVLDAKAAGSEFPSGSYGWNGAGGSKMWVIPAENRLLLMWIANGALQAEITRAVVAVPTQ